MNTLINMNPWSMLADLLDTNSRAFRNVQAHAAGRFPPMNVYLDDHAVIIDAELPGRMAKDVTLSLEPQAVILAEKRVNATTDADGKTVEETVTPRWSRRLELPFRVDVEKANAKFTNGILRIELPKQDAPAVRKILISE